MRWYWVAALKQREPKLGLGADYKNIDSNWQLVSKNRKSAAAILTSGH